MIGKTPTSLRCLGIDNGSVDDVEVPGLEAGLD
jgi:hypothetical protein